MDVIIAGGRDYIDYKTAKQKCDKILKNVKEPIRIISGRCSTGKLTFTTEDGTMVCGADGCGERYAKERGYPVIPVPPDFKRYGYKVAQVIRNEEMAKISQALILFWDGKSRGSKNMKENAEKYNLLIRVINY